MICASCKSDIEPIAPKAKWKVITVLLWIGTLTASLAFSLPLGLNVILVPAWFFMVGPAVGTAARLAKTWTCPNCSAATAEPEKVLPETPASPLRPAIPAHA